MDPRMIDQVNHAIKCEAEIMQTLEGKQRSVSAQIAQYTGQIEENESVLSELQLVGEKDGNVFKLIGPILVKEEADEAISNVSKRLEFMQNKMKDLEAESKANSTGIQASHAKIMKMQGLFEKAKAEVLEKMRQDKEQREMQS